MTERLFLGGPRDLEWMDVDPKAWDITVPVSQRSFYDMYLTSRMDEFRYSLRTAGLLGRQVRVFVPTSRHGDSLNDLLAHRVLNDVGHQLRNQGSKP